MSPVMSRPRLPASGSRNRGAIAAVVIATAVLVLLGVLLTRLGADRSVADIHVDNPTPYDLTVEVAGAARDGWTGIGVAGRRGTTDLLQVGDEGATWVFRFSYAGDRAAELTVPRATLERDGWKLRIPDSVAEELRVAGLGPPP